MEPVLASSLVGDYVTALLIASVPGVLVALLTQYLTVRRQNEVERQMVANAQLLLSLEFEDNQQALATFWTGLNALDKEESHPDDQDAHLIAIVRAGLLNQTIPRWSHVRWQHVSPRALAEISPKDLAVMDQCYRDLDAISDLFTKLITLNPDEKAYLDGGHRFWYNNFPDIRKDTYARLVAAVARALAAPNPLKASIR